MCEKTKYTKIPIKQKILNTKNIKILKIHKTTKYQICKK